MSELKKNAANVRKIVAALSDVGTDVAADAERMTALQLALYLLADKYGRGVVATTIHLVENAPQAEVELNVIQNEGVSF